MAKGTYADFLNVLGRRESGDAAHPNGNYAAENTFHYIGKYQMGEAALVDIGVVNLDGNAFDNDYSGGFTGKFGLTSKADFLASPSGQEQAIRAYMAVQFGYLDFKGALVYADQVIDSIKITISSLLGMAHLVGFTRAADFVKSGGDNDPADAFGTKASEYAELLSDYLTPFAVDHRGNEAIAGGSGTDGLWGRDGNDALSGKAGSDWLYGGNGKDVLCAGWGKDTLSGGEGADRFFWSRIGEIGNGSTADRIADFASGQDRIDLSQIDSNTGIAGNQAFSFVGDAALNGAGQLHFANGVLSGDVNGDSTADFRLVLTAVDSLGADDFIL
jgi:Ca2+-binding RTX toxin-like protein